MARQRTAVQDPPSASNGVGEWQRRRFAKATLPTGQEVTLRCVTLDELAADEALPDDLVSAAVHEKTGLALVELARRVNEPDGAKQAREYSQTVLRLRDRLVLRAVTEVGGTPVTLTEEDLPDLDPFDKDMIANLASRQTDEDATLRRVWGLDPLATFRDLCVELGCAPDCPTRKALELDVPKVQ